MTTVKFNGFAEGSTVTIGGVTVQSWGGVTEPVTGSVWDQPPSPGTSVTITARRSDYGVAPDGMFFEVDLSGFETNTPGSINDYDNSYHDKAFFWDYEEAYDFEAPTQVLAMDTADGGDRRNSRYSRGPMGAHVYRQPGSYVVRLAVFEPSSARWGQGRFRIGGSNADTPAIGDPNSFFAGNRTLYVNTTGNYSNGIPGAVNFNNFNAAWSALDAASVPSRIVLERGQSHTISDTRQYRPPSGASQVSLRVEARPGAGPKPVLQAAGNFSNLFDQAGMFIDRSKQDGNPISSVTVFRDLDLRGTWDTRTETGTWDNRLINFFSNGADHCLVDGCDFAGGSRGVAMAQTGPGRNERLYIINDSSVTDWGDYAIYDGDSGFSAYLGVRLAQNVDARAGGPKDGTHNNHGPIRFPLPNRTIIASCDLFSNTGWSDNGGGVQAIQPCIRWGTSPSFSGGRLLLVDSALEGPRLPIQIAMANNQATARHCNALLEGNIIVAGFQSFGALGLTHGGPTIRNNMVIFPDTDYSANEIGGSSNNPSSFVYARSDRDSGRSAGANLTTPIRIYNNTVVNLSGTQLSGIWRGNGWGFSTVEVANNLLHEPNAGNTPYDPVNPVLAFPARFRGYRSSSALSTRFGNPTDSPSLWVPQIDSQALGAALSNPDAFTDFRGATRPEPPTIGALEAD